MRSKHILVPLDLIRSPASALAAVQQMAASGPVCLTLLHVVELNIFPPQAAANDQLRAESQAALRKLARLFFGAAQAARIEVRFGDAADEILSLAKEIKPDLIVMCGPKPGRRFFRRRTTQRVLRAAPCPALVLPYPEKPASQTPRTWWRALSEEAFFHAGIRRTDGTGLKTSEVTRSRLANFAHTEFCRVGRPENEWPNQAKCVWFCPHCSFRACWHWPCLTAERTRV